MKFLSKLSLHVALVAILVAIGALVGADQTNSDQPEEPSSSATAKVTVTPPAAANSPPASNDTSSPSVPTVKPTKKAKTADLPVCPAECECAEKKVVCATSTLKSVPNLSKHSTISEIVLSGNPIESVDVSMLPTSSLESLNLSQCKIKSFSNPTKKLDTLPKLKTLILTSNKLVSLQSGLSAWKMPMLDMLDLQGNPLEEIGPNAFNNTKSLTTLRLERTKLKSISELAFAPLTQLRHLNLSYVRLSTPLGDRQFANNQQIESLDLTGNGLIEVPHALRSTSSIKTLIMNENNMTSLRQSDFVGRSALVNLEVSSCLKLTNIDDHTFSGLYELRRLILSDNPSLRYISKEAFKSEQGTVAIELIDISNSNISTLSDPAEFTSLTFNQLNLNNNPWQCNCDLKWLLTFVATHKLLAHCKGPEKYKDIEIGQFFLTNDCEVIYSSYHTAIVAGFLIVLVGMMVLVFVQKSDLCRRFLSKDQYGTIYYTKANFPPESVQ